MKKFLSFVVLLVALAVCIAALVACNPSSGNQATPQSIEFVDKDGVNRYTYWELGEFDYGTAYADILPIFTLNLCYSDGSTKPLAASEYTVSYLYGVEEVSLAEMPAVPDAGYYQIIFDKDDFQARMLFTIGLAARADITVSLSRNVWEYDESPAQLTIEGYTPSATAPVEYFCVSKDVYDALSDERKAEYWRHTMPMYALGDEPCTLAVGEYYAYAKIPEDDNYDVYYTAITPETAFTVNKAVLRYDAAVADNLWAVYNFNSNGVLDAVNLGAISITTRDFSVSTWLKDRTGTEILGSYVWADPSTLVDADDSGEYFACYQVDPLLEACYTVEDGSIPVEVTINKGSVRLPALGIPDNKLHAANEGFGPYPDNALPYVVVNDIGGYRVHIYNSWDENTMQVSVAVDDGEPVYKYVGKDADNDYYVNWGFINPGKYTVTLSLRNKTNFVWWEGDAAKGTDDIVLTFEIKEKKAVPVPSVHLRDSATDTDGMDFVTLDGQSRCIDFTDFTDGAIEPKLNGEYSYPVADTENTAYYLLEADELKALIDTSVGYGTITVTLVPAAEYTWEDDTATPVEYTCKINGGSTFFPRIKEASAYTVFEPENPTADDAMQLLMNWYGADGAGEMETDCRNYKAEVYFYASQDGTKASYVGTVANSHTDPDKFGTYSMTFHLTDFTNKSAPTYYNGTAEVTEGSDVDSTIYPKEESISIDKITDYDMPFFLIANVDCREAVQGESIEFAYAAFGDCTVIRMKGTGENSAEGTTTSSEVYMIFRDGEYVGHEIKTTVKIGEVSSTHSLHFALIP